MKIIIAVNFFPPSIGGSQIVAKKIADFFHDRGHEIFVITRKVKGRKESQFPYKIFEYYPNDYKGFLQTVKNISPDLVFVYSDVFDFFRHTFSTNRRMIIAPCGCNWSLSNRSNSNFLYRSADLVDKIICHSEFDRDFKLCSSGKLSKKCIVIPNGVDLNEFDNNTIKREELLPEHVNKRWIVNVSNFFPGKGQEHMIDVLNFLDDEIVYVQINSDIEFQIGEQLEIQWKKLVGVELKKKISVVHKKNLSRQETIGYIKQSNAFVLTSEKEVAPLVILESMASSTPWVSTDVGNVRGLKGGKYVSAIKDSRYHSLFDARVFKLLSGELKNVLENPSIGEDGRIQIEKEMTWEKILPQYASAIEK